MRKNELPATMLEIASLIGVQATLELSRAFGGITLDIPLGVIHGARYESIAEIIGHEYTQKLCAHFGGCAVYIAKCSRALIRVRNDSIRAAHKAGEPVNFLVARFSLSDRQIWTILKVEGNAG